MLRRAKIVCTIGPASRDEKTIRTLVENGMDVARINFSHGDHTEHGEVYERIRNAGDRVAVMQDLMGPKIRIGEVDTEGLRLAADDTVTLAAGGGLDGAVVPVTYPGFAEDLSPGDTIYLADGIIHLEVTRVEGETVACRVIHGGVLTSRMGVNLPGVDVRSPALTDKDRRDLSFGLRLGVDFVALSFVRSPKEVEEVRRIVREEGSPAQVVAKIEKGEALDGLEGIVAAADALMIARGDLGVEIPTEDVPVVQKKIIACCVGAGKPVITATQMLESMVRSGRPTRAEASDVANAVLDGSDALMLSAETAMGEHPVESLQMMDRIIRRTENYAGTGAAADASGDVSRVHRGMQVRHSGGVRGSGRSLEGVCASAVAAAEEIGASAIACLTHTGRTARTIAKHRPAVPILALTDDPPVIRQMALVWGVEAIPVGRIDSTERIFAVARERVEQAGFGGKVVLTAGIPTQQGGPTNTVHVLEM
ncbi:MAG: pyruvate kinase [bacterium]|nr:MAG: pyruvate kinase [bacterium]